MAEEKAGRGTNREIALESSSLVPVSWKRPNIKLLAFSLSSFSVHTTQCINYIFETSTKELHNWFSTTYRERPALRTAEINLRPPLHDRF